MITTLNKIGYALPELLNEFTLPKQRWGEFLPLANYSFKDDENYRPYNFAQGKPFTAIASYPTYTQSYTQYLYNPYYMKDGLINPSPTYYSDRKNYAFIKIAKDSNTNILNGINNQILNTIWQKGIPDPDNILLLSPDYADPRNYYPPVTIVKTDGLLYPIIKTAKYFLPNEAGVFRTKEYTAKINHIKTKGDFPKTEIYYLDGHIRFEDPKINWDSFTKASDNPDDDLNMTKLIHFELRPQTPEQALNGIVIGVANGRAMAEWSIWTQVAEGDIYDIVNNVARGGEVEIEIQLNLAYDVRDSYLKMQTLDENHNINVEFFNDKDNVGDNTDYLFYKNFSAFKDDYDNVQFNYISKTGARSYNSPQYENITYEPAMISHCIFDKDKNLLDLRHYWYDDTLPLITSPPEISDGLWNNKDNLNNYLNKLNIDNYPHCYGANIFNEINIPTKLMPLLNKPDDLYVINKSGSQAELFSINSGLYICVVDSKNKIIYFVLIDGRGYFDLDMSLILDHEIDFCTFDKKTNLLYVGKYNKGTPDLNQYSLFKLKFFINDGNRKKFYYEYDKISMSFIPCQTHCLAKGGIISKV